MNRFVRAQTGKNRSKQAALRAQSEPEDLQEQDPELIELLADMRTDLAAFATFHFPPFKYAHHLYPLVDALHKVNTGEIDRLIVAMPPRHSKSLLTSQMFPAWFLGHNPDSFVIAASYGYDLVREFGSTVRNVVTSEMFKLTFPEAGIKGKSAAAHKFSLQGGGKYYATSIGGVATGKGAHLFLIDDPYKLPEEAASETYRKRIEEWYKSVAYTRLQTGGRIVVIATRWHELDLTGWLLREHPHENWHVISMPAIAEQDEHWNGALWRKEGEPLWPDFL